MTKVEIKRKFLGDVTTNPSFLQSQTQDQKIETILTSIYKLETVMGGLTPLHNPSLLKSFIFYIQTKKFCKKNFTKKIYLFVIGLYLINMAGEKKKNMAEKLTQNRRVIGRMLKGRGILKVPPANPRAYIYR